MAPHTPVSPLLFKLFLWERQRKKKEKSYGEDRGEC